MTWIDSFLNRITMYRLGLYYLIGLVLAAVVLSLFGAIPYSPIAILVSAIGITIICLIVNAIFAKIFKAPTNAESAYITALILTLIIAPPAAISDTYYLNLAGFAAALAMASKYILAIRKKHIFNPAAIAVVLTAFLINQSGHWWVGTVAMMPFVLIGGLLMVRKLRRLDLFISFLIVAVFVNIKFLTIGFLVSSPLLFFAFVMLTEPQTTPPTRKFRIMYGVVVGLLFSPAIHLGSLYSTPELALVVGNLFSFMVSPKEKLMLKLKARTRIAADIYEYIFQPSRALAYAPGQYLEWTLPHAKPDLRGNRRYFTIASSPTEPELRLGVKFYPTPSSFKKKLASMSGDDVVVASQLAGDFTLPSDKNIKLVFIAGGIGVTPFRSMIKYLLDKHEKRNIVLLYSVRNADDIAYREIFNAASPLGIRTSYHITDIDGYLDAKKIVAAIPDYHDRMFYISGPQAIVTTLSGVLRTIGIKKSHIKKDFFPGFA